MIRDGTGFRAAEGLQRYGVERLSHADGMLYVLAPGYGLAVAPIVNVFDEVPDNEGWTWCRPTNGMPGEVFYTLVHDGSRLHAGGPAGISTWDGTDWTLQAPYTGLLESSVNTMRQDQSGTVWAFGYGMHQAKTSSGIDWNAEWVTGAEVTGAGASVFDSYVDGDNLYLATQGGVWAYRDEGGGFEWSSYAPVSNLVYTVAARGDTILHTTPDGLVLSRDGGGTWERLTRPSDEAVDEFDGVRTMVLADHVIPDQGSIERWYLTTPYKLWISDDQGTSWTERNVPGASEVPHALFVLDAETLILVSSRDIVVSLDGAQSFGVRYAGEDGLPETFYSATYRDGTLYVAGNDGIRLFDVGGF